MYHVVTVKYKDRRKKKFLRTEELDELISDHIYTIYKYEDSWVEKDGFAFSAEIRYPLSDIADIATDVSEAFPDLIFSFYFDDSCGNPCVIYAANGDYEIKEGKIAYPSSTL